MWSFRKLTRKSSKSENTPKSLTEVSAASLGETESFAASIIFHSGKAGKCYILSSSGAKNGLLNLMGEVSEKILQAVLQSKEDYSVSESFQPLLERCSAPSCILAFINDKMFSFSKGENHIYAFDLNNQILHEISDSFLALKHFTGYIYLISSQYCQEIINYLLRSSRENLLPSEISAGCINLAREMGIKDFSISLIGMSIPVVNTSSLKRLKLYGACSDIGLKRAVNEDSVIASNVKYSSSGKTWSSFILLVADGAGGHLHGEEASREALKLSFVEILKSNIISSGDKETLLFTLRNIVQSINERIASLRERKRSDLATTLTMAFILGNDVFVAHCGDSRAYMLKGNDLSLITEDHKYVMDLVKAGIMTLEEAKFSPQRNILTSALGMRSPRVDFKHFSLEGDEILLLCSDGLTDLVSEEEIKAYLKHYKYPSLVSQALINLANNRGGFDNISVAVLVPGSLIF